MARSGLALQPDALDRVATSASELDDSPGMIRPITLNVIKVTCSRRAARPRRPLDAGRLVRHYIEQSVEQPAIRRLRAARVERAGDRNRAPNGRKLREGTGRSQTRLRPGEVRAVMNSLWAAALARLLSMRRTQGVWELSHDFVARAVARYLGRRRLDWPGLTRAFAAPVLFVLMAAAAAGAIAWNVNAADRARAELAEFGVEVSSTPTGLEADAGGRFKAEDLARAASLLGRLTALQTLDLSNTKVADLGPLKGLTALQTSLTLSSMQVADLGPLKGLTALQTLNLRR